MLRALASSEFWTSSEMASLRVVTASVERRRIATDSGSCLIVGASEGILISAVSCNELLEAAEDGRILILELRSWLASLV